MADRLKPPDLTTEKLNLKGLMTFRKTALASKERKAKRKRPVASSYPRTSETTEMDDILLKPVCIGDSLKKRRVYWQPKQTG